MFLFFFLGWDLYVAFLFPWVRLICDNKLFRQETFPALFCNVQRTLLHSKSCPFQNFTRVNSEVLNPHFANISKIFYLNWGDHFSIWFKRIFWRLGILFTARSNKVSLDSSPQKSFMILHSKYFFFHIQSFTIQAWLFQS